MGRNAFWRKDDVAEREARKGDEGQAALLLQQQKDMKAKRDATATARNARGGGGFERRPGLGSNTILTSLLGLLGAPQGMGPRGLIGG